MQSDNNFNNSRSFVFLLEYQYYFSAISLIFSEIPFSKKAKLKSYCNDFNFSSARCSILFKCRLSIF